MSSASIKGQEPLSGRGPGLSLLGLRVAQDAQSFEWRPLLLRGGGAEVDLEGLLALPGLINAHDHLDFALFPRLGEGGSFRNAREWAEAIYRPEEPPIRECLRISKQDRIRWGELRNLLGGVTTVCHHNPYEPSVGETPVRVVRDFGWAHSLSFERDVRGRFDTTPDDWPFVIHAAEGVDEESRTEIDALDSLGVLAERTMVVHATACGAREWRLLEERGCGVVWCPSSNRFMFGRTTEPDILLSGPPVALGTDSPLTADGGLFEELACAADCGTPPEALYAMVTETPVRMLRLPARPDDWVLLRDRGRKPCEALLDEPALEAVFVDGRASLLSEGLAKAHPGLAEGLEPLRYGGGRYRVRADVSGLLERARAALGPEIRLGGAPISEAAP